MALLLNLRISLLNILKTNHIKFGGKNICNTSCLLWLDHGFLRPSSFKEKENRFLEKDKVPQNYQLIYKAPMESYVAWAMHVSTGTASIIGIAAVYQFFSNQPIQDPVGTTLAMQSDDIYFFAAGFLAINAVLRLVVFVYTLRIYKDKGKYLSVYHSQLPLGISHNHFEKGEVKPVHYMFSPWNNVTYKLGGKTSYILEDYFKTPSEFHKMREIESVK